jgi:serine/threonine protein kinase
VLDTKREVVWTYPAMTQARFGCAVVVLSNSRVVVLAGSSGAALVSSEGVQLQACPLSTQIAAVELELQQVSGRGSSLNPFKTGGKAKTGSLKAFLKELRENLKEEDIVRQSSVSAFDDDRLPVYDNGRIVAKKELKESGQARVYKGFMKEKDGTKKDVAIKVFKTKADWDDCKQELVTLLKISGHPNVMEVLDFYEVPSPAFIMRYVAGGDLNDYLRKKGKFSGKPAVRLLKGIGQGIQHLHSHGIVHRDLKSPNILLEGSGSAMRPVLIDLGLGRRVNDGDGQFQTRGMMGTAAWMAPEMISKAYWSTKTDMYALGIIMWEVLTAGVPYPGKNFTQIVTQVHATDARPSVTLLTKNKVPQVQINLVQSLWHKDPTKRPSADVFLRQLE